MSLEVLEQHRRVWARKPALQRVYEAWFERLLACAGPGQRVLEVGAGPGLLAPFARRARPDLEWIASDLIPARWNDLAADALRLPLQARSVDVVAGLDVIHHFARPAAFFAEAARVLRTGGTLTLVEPWVTPLSYPIYRWLHPEGCDLSVDCWHPFPEGDKDAFAGNGALASLLVRRTPPARWSEWGLSAPRATVLNAFAYLPTLGFRGPSLLPAPLVRPLLALDRLAPLSRVLGLRAHLAWTREDDQAAGRGRAASAAAVP